MSDDQPRPEAGYADAEIAAALDRLEGATTSAAGEPALQDLRALAVGILVVAFLGTWLVLVLRMIAMGTAGRSWRS